MVTKDDQFEASASALGYLYQFAKALELCIERSMGGLEWSVAVEAADDIETHAGSLTELLQLKQRAEGIRLTDTSEDLWKTLRIWCEADLNRRIDLAETDLFLLTTAELSADSAGHHLQPKETGHRDVDEALRLLRLARKASKNEKLQKSFKAFDALETSGPERQRELLSRVDVIGHSPRINEIRSGMLKRAVLAVERDLATAFLTRLEGWFYGRVIEQLTTPGKAPITGSEFDEVFSRLRGQFSPNNLPIDQDIMNLEPEPVESADKTFVRQLDLIGVGPDRVHLAVRDYIRAFAQRSRWSEEKLLRPGEIGDYERRLVEEWQARFAEMREELGPEATEKEMKREARQIYSWVDREARAQIRNGLQEVFIPKGSYHMLADELRVGWHPDFSARLAALLEPAGAS
ncbi:ABC-three component system protein [Nocardiopsis quinghaiensis]|uniref:ABC-three component system protein n=1 Tax=Nocardiopsis quinghaiensis TaxID=464995 RepID=UPI00123C213F|nr:ABC-three component system protein [Nocardiopsis quinghaiensis]